MAAIGVCFMWSLACLRVLPALVHFHARVSPPYMHVSSSFLHLALTARLGSIMGVASLSCKLGSIPASPLLCDFEQRLNAAFMSSPEKIVELLPSPGMGMGGSVGVTWVPHRPSSSCPPKHLLKQP